jgi:hypothetical protein
MRIKQLLRTILANLLYAPCALVGSAVISCRFSVRSSVHSDVADSSTDSCILGIRLVLARPGREESTDAHIVRTATPKAGFCS